MGGGDEDWNWSWRRSGRAEEWRGGRLFGERWDVCMLVYCICCGPGSTVVSSSVVFVFVLGVHVASCGLERRWVVSSRALW